jgi:plastocyanin
VPLVKNPVGAFRPLRGSLDVGDQFLRPQRIRTRAGRRVTWRFDGAQDHSVAVANGPRGFSSPWISRGSYSFRPRVRGTYRLFCSLHPASMTQELKVE